MKAWRMAEVMMDCFEEIASLLLNRNLKSISII